MYVLWQHRRRNQIELGGGPEVHWSATLVENERVDGQPKQRHVAFLTGFNESAVKILDRRCRIWDQVSETLDWLGIKAMMPGERRLTAEEREKIEAAIAMKVPRPTAAEYKDNARKRVQLGGGWNGLTDRQRAALWEND